MLRELNALAQIKETDYEFAVKMLKQPMSKRLEWLEDTVYDKMMQSDTVTMSDVIKIIKKLGGC